MMAVVKIILLVVYAVICIGLICVVLLQSGKSAGLTGSIGGAAETYWGKNKARSLEGTFEKYTKLGAFGFIAITILLNILA
jgi:preprotein translocase subunit SecG